MMTLYIIVNTNTKYAFANVSIEPHSLYIPAEYTLFSKMASSLTQPLCLFHNFYFDS